MRDLLDGSSGEYLELSDYLRDYEKRFWEMDENGLWKLERRQHFKEPNFPSWDAFAAGHWGEALRLAEGMRSRLTDFYRSVADKGLGFRRVRVVEEPIIPYLQWELHLLHLRSECGEDIRIIGPGRVEKFEAVAPVPELVSLGAEAVYEVCYDDEGVARGAIRFTDKAAVARAREFIQRLYAIGEDIREFFEHRVAHLDPPVGE
jgi:hypothetical protein